MTNMIAARPQAITQIDKPPAGKNQLKFGTTA
jgi:hypothetical protein